MQISTFKIEGETFGVPTLLVEELFRPLPITWVPGADARIEGMANIRGRTAVVINMRQCLGLGRADHSVLNEMVLFETQAGLVQEARDLGLKSFEEPVVLRVDETTGIVGVASAEIHPAPAHVSQEFVDGVAELDGLYVTLISIHRLVQELLPKKAEV
jgi:chemotaxis signal transduction protein